MTRTEGSDSTAHASLAAGVGFVPSVSVQVKSNLWYVWARIALQHEQQAHRERARLVEEWGTPDAQGDIAPEMQASMVSLVAVAFAIDALHADVAPLVGRNADPRTGRGKAWSYQLETFRTALPTVAPRWESEMKWLAMLRRAAVHPQPVFHEPRPHPGLPTSVAEEYRLFSCESATRAVDFLMTVFRSLFMGSVGDDQVLAWGRESQHVCTEFGAIRSSSRS